MQKLVPHRHLLNFSIGLCGQILFSDFQTNFFPLKSKTFTLKSLMHYFWLLTLSSTILFKFLDALWASQFDGRQHNYSTKTRQAGWANEQSMYSLMSMVVTDISSLGRHETGLEWTILWLKTLFWLTAFAHFLTWFIPTQQCSLITIFKRASWLGYV